MVLLSFLPTLGAWVCCCGVGVGGEKRLQVFYGGGWPGVAQQAGSTDLGRELGA